MIIQKTGMTMGVAVPVPAAALEAVDRKPYLEAARKVGLKRALEGLAKGYRRTGKLQHRFASRAEYEAGFPPGQVPDLLPEVDAVVIFEFEVERKSS